MVWVVSRGRNLIYKEPKRQSIMTDLTTDLLAGGDLIMLASQHISS
jgi:hypothetical protein